MEIMTQLLILATNRPGTLANICGTLGDEKINIQGISVVDHVDHALIRIVVDDPTKAIHLLGEAGLPVMEDRVLRILMDGGPGELEQIANIVSEVGLNIHYAYATESPAGGKSSLILKTDDDERALQALEKRKKG